MQDYSAQPLKTFQLDKLSVKQKSDWAYGKQLAQYIDSTIRGGISSYFWVRNARWRTNRGYANGRVPMSKFQDLLEFNGKVNYININWQSINIVNRVVSGLVGRWMGRSEKIKVSATDSISTKQKKEEFENIEFIIENRKMIEKLQQESGVQLIPEQDSLPEDKEELKLWQSQFQRLPEEIQYELACNDILQANGWFDVLKEKMLHDSAETGFVATYTYMDEQGVIHVEWLKPENCFYSYSQYPDFRDTTWRGVIRTYKISELRRKYGTEFGGKINEEELWKMAQFSKEFQLYDNITWLTEWNVTFLRPYDEWNIDVIEFELKTVDNDPYTVVTTKKNKSTLVKKGRPERMAENEEIVSDTKWNIYRGVFCRPTNTMLEWGLKKNMIRPQDPKEIGNAEFSYSFYMVQNYDMTSLAIPEKIQEPVDQMIIARLKMQQLVAKMRPTGSLINWDALQNIDYGLGDGNKAIDVKKLYDQTGDLYYRGRDAEGNPVPVPVTELANAGFLSQLQGLIMLYDKHYSILKDELGEDPNLIASAIQPRVAVANIDTAQQQAQFATDYFYWAYTNCMADTAKKVSCLLKTSVSYGAEVYRSIVGVDDVEGRIFNAKIQMLPDQAELARFDALLQQTMAASPDLVLFVDPFQLMRVAKEDVKLAEAIFRKAQKKMIIYNQTTAAQNQQATFQGQMQAAQVAEQEKRATKEQESLLDIKKAQMIAESQNRTAVLQMASSLYLKQQETGQPIPAEIMPLIQSVMENVALAAVVSTDEQKQELAAKMQAAQMEQMAMQQQAQQEAQQSGVPLPEEEQMPQEEAMIPEEGLAEENASDIAPGEEEQIPQQ
jgi:hypothetical protein